MKALIWCVTAVVALAWTATAALLVALARWLAAALGDDPSVALPSLRMPAWLLDWVDPTWLHALLDSLVVLAEGLWTWVPWAQSVVEWTIPLIWIVWGLGIIPMLLIGWVASRAVAGATRQPGPVAAAEPLGSDDPGATTLPR